MGKHELLDRFVVGMGSLYGESLKFFNKSLESESIRDTIQHITVEGLPDSFEKGEYTVDAVWKSQPLRTRFTATHWKGSDFPTLIFHHGSGDQPYFIRINKIIPPDKPNIPFNIIATDSPFNRTKKEYFSAIGELQNFVLIFALSTKLIEAIIDRLRANGPGKIVVSGISLGGWITNLHHTYFNTADEYRPIFAGAAPDALFSESVYARMGSKLIASQPDQLSRVLNFEEDFQKQDNSNVYPLLARYDQYIQYERQHHIYKPDRETVIEKAHITGAMDDTALRNHLEEAFVTLPFSSHT